MALLPSPLRALAMIVAVSSSLLTVFTLTVLLTVAHDAQLVGEEDLDYGTGVSLHASLHDPPVLTAVLVLLGFTVVVMDNWARS